MATKEENTTNSATMLFVAVVLPPDESIHSIFLEMPSVVEEVVVVALAVFLKIYLAVDLLPRRRSKEVRTFG